MIFELTNIFYRLIAFSHIHGRSTGVDWVKKGR